MVNDIASLFHFHEIDNHSNKTLFLFHGTGGDERNFLFLNEILGGKYNLVGLRGNISENGSYRFFRRNTLGIFDQESIREESNKLHKFLQGWKIGHSITNDDCVSLGYSNGANIILASLFYHPGTLKNLILLHPMLPFDISPHSHDFSSHQIVVSYGQNDQMVSEAEFSKVVKALELNNAHPTVIKYASGHELSSEELRDVIHWLNLLTDKKTA